MIDLGKSASPLHSSGIKQDVSVHVPRAIDNFVVRLRKYVEEIPSKPRHLLTVRGLGYRFVAEPDD